MMKNIILALSIVFLLISCKDNKSVNEKREIIDIDRLNLKSEFNISYDFVDSVKFINLLSDNENFLSERISKIKITKSRIYILDKRQNKLIVFDNNGKAIAQVGRKGQGPNEYLQINEFDVDLKGNIYIVDGRLDKLFIYDNSFNFKLANKLPFEADILKVLDNGDYLWGLSSWNMKMCSNDKIIVTNKDLKHLKTLCKYDDYHDDNYWISSYSFVETEKYIIYNRPIDNDVLLFDKTTLELEKIIEFNFGNKNVPDEKKKDVERNLRYFKNYNMLKWITVVEDSFVLGTFWDKMETRPFFIDIKSNNLYVGKSTIDRDVSTVKGYEKNKILISYIEPESEKSKSEKLPKDVQKHLKNGNFVLCLTYLK